MEVMPVGVYSVRYTTLDRAWWLPPCRKIVLFNFRKAWV